jgi:hypothetical protein
MSIVLISPRNCRENKKRTLIQSQEEFALKARSGSQSVGKIVICAEQTSILGKQEKKGTRPSEVNKEVHRSPVVLRF